MKTPRPGFDTMKDGYEIFDQSTPWKGFLLMGLGWSLTMCAFYWLLEYAGQGEPPLDSWPLNFLVWFLVGIGVKLTVWWSGGYIGRRNARWKARRKNDV